MKVSIIVAQALNRTIGVDGRLPWSLPSDLAFFKQMTTGFPIIMGRLTFESIGRPLPGRHSIILTRKKNYEVPVGCTVVHSLKEALEVARADKVEEAFIIGGGKVYKEALELVDVLYVTQVHIKLAGDTFFPAIDEKVWREVRCVKHLPDSRHRYAYEFCTYVRR